MTEEEVYLHQLRKRVKKLEKHYAKIKPSRLTSSTFAGRVFGLWLKQIDARIITTILIIIFFVFVVYPLITSLGVIL